MMDNEDFESWLEEHYYDCSIEVEKISDEKAEKAWEEVRRCGGYFSKDDLTRLFKAWKRASPKRRGYIYAMLDEAGYDTLIELLCDGDYERAAAWIKEDLY